MKHLDLQHLELVLSAHLHLVRRKRHVQYIQSYMAILTKKLQHTFN